MQSIQNMQHFCYCHAKTTAHPLCKSLGCRPSFTQCHETGACSQVRHCTLRRKMQSIKCNLNTLERMLPLHDKRSPAADQVPTLHDCWTRSRQHPLGCCPEVSSSLAPTSKVCWVVVGPSGGSPLIRKLVLKDHRNISVRQKDIWWQMESWLCQKERNW